MRITVIPAKAGIYRSNATRAAIGEERFIYVGNEDVIERPLEVFARIYEPLEMKLTAEAEPRLAAYREGNAPGAHGVCRLHRPIRVVS